MKTFKSLSSALIAEFFPVWEVLALATTPGPDYGISISPFYCGRSRLQGACRTHL